MPTIKPPVTYDEVWTIVEDSSLSYSAKKNKLEGLIRRLVTEILNDPDKQRRNDYEYRLIEVLRGMESIASED